MSPVCVKFIFPGSVSFLIRHVGFGKYPKLLQASLGLVISLRKNWSSMFGINEKCQGLVYNCQKNANFLKHINAEVFILQLCVFLIDLKLFFPNECLAHGNLKETKTCGFSHCICRYYLLEFSSNVVLVYNVGS